MHQFSRITFNHFENIGLLILTLLLFSPGFLAGQKASDIIELTYDFKNRRFTPEALDSLLALDKRNKFYRIKVDSIDRRIWQIKLTTSDSSVSQSVSAAELFGGIGISTISSVADNLTPIGNVLAPIFEMIAPQDPAGWTMMGIFDNVSGGEKGVDFAPQELINLIGRYQNKMSDYYKGFILNKARIDSLSGDIAISLLAHLARDTMTDRKLRLVQLSPYAIIDSLRTLKEEFIEDQSGMIDSMKLYRTKYSKLLESTDSATIRKSIISANEAIIDHYAQLNEAYEQLAQSINDTLLIGVTKSIVAANNLAYLGIEWTSDIFQYGGDVNTINLHFEPIAKDVGYFDRTASLRIPVYKPKTSFGVSSGFFISGLGSPAWSVRTNADSSFSVVKEKPGTMEMGVSALLRIVQNNDKNIGWQLGFGPGVSFKDKLRPRIMLELGAALGPEKRLLVGAGLLVGTRDKLSESINPTTTYKIRPEKFTVAETVTGLFLSISYLIN